ncbi:MAG: hypothetical protein B6U97_03445 [Candidatus Altiarchaeales archaeon ex4484_96]|nr:MAG: hypothetical protein B6U97_03445 [Candidatus Altiarchaeales archaeon ex4484_96]
MTTVFFSDDDVIKLHSWWINNCLSDDERKAKTVLLIDGEIIEITLEDEQKHMKAKTKIGEKLLKIYRNYFTYKLERGELKWPLEY